MTNYDFQPKVPGQTGRNPETKTGIEDAKAEAVKAAKELVAAWDNQPGPAETKPPAVEQAEEHLSQTLHNLQELAGVEAMIEHLDYLNANHFGNPEESEME